MAAWSLQCPQSSLQVEGARVEEGAKAGAPQQEGAPLQGDLLLECLKIPTDDDDNINRQTDRG